MKPDKFIDVIEVQLLNIEVAFTNEVKVEVSILLLRALSRGSIPFNFLQASNI